MKFVVFHGAFGSPDGNWFPQLKETLTNLEQTVVVPTFPTDDWGEMLKAGKNFKPKKQLLKNWFRVFEKIMKGFKKGEKLCFVGHSLGPLFILHVVEKYGIKLDSAIFVSPFLDSLGNWKVDIVNKTFYKTDFDWKKLKNSYRLLMSYTQITIRMLMVNTHWNLQRR